jgi:hypothetical protein
MGKIELNKTVYHKDIYDGQREVRIVGIRADEVELQGTWEYQKGWHPIEGVLFERPKTEEEKVNIDLKSINGHEILKFLEEQLKDNDDLCDVSVEGPLEFEGQSFGKCAKTKEPMYTLSFTANYDNWGHDQDIEGNELQITKEGVIFLLQEPFEGDGSDSALEEVLEPWLKTHKFASSEEVFVKWQGMVQFCCEVLEQMSFDDTKRFEHVMEELKEARALMK